MYRNYLKRLIDIFFSIFFLILISPVMLTVSILNLIFTGRPIFFIQDRPGLNEKIFKIIKFRTMSDIKANQENFETASREVTKFGHILRETSIDELPELVNILLGDMSFIGPRPLLVRYLPYYSEEEKRRHSVRPGLTGLAQVKGRNALTWTEKFKYDIYYVENISFAMDLKILLLTLKKVLKRENIELDPNQVEPWFDEYVKKKRHKSPIEKNAIKK